MSKNKSKHNKQQVKPAEAVVEDIAIVNAAPAKLKKATQDTVIVAIQKQLKNTNGSGGVDATNLDLAGSDFKGLVCQGVDFSGSDISDSDFSGTDIRWCNFTGCKQDGIIVDAATKKDGVVGLIA